MENSALVTMGLPISLSIIMVGMGLSLKLEDFKEIQREPKSVLVGSLLQFIGMALIGFGLGYAVGGGLLGATMVLCAVLPGGTTSNVLTYLAKANLALSIALTLIASLVTIFSIPFFVNYAFTLFLGEGESLSLPIVKTLITMLAIVVIPVGIGMLVKNRKPVFARKVEPIIGKFSIFVLVAIIAGIMLSERNNIMIWLESAWLPALGLMAAGIVLGFVASKLAGLPTKDGLTIAIEMSIKNSTLGLTIVLTLLNSPEMAIPVAVYGLLMYPVVGLLVFCGRRINA
jgi:bile acid:Na+ symporter, BASS family